MKKSALILILCALLLLVGLNSIYVVEENQYACTVRFSEIIATADTAGLHFKLPFVDNISYFSKATQFYDIPPSEVLTSDKQNMTADCYVLWDRGPQEVLPDPGHHRRRRASSGCLHLQ